MKYINEQGEVTEGKKVEWQSTWFQRNIRASYKDLVEFFGEPEKFTFGKSDAQWTIMTPAGIATIYNYKDGKNYLGDEGRSTEDIRDWHVGGRFHEVVHYIYKVLGAICAPHA